MASRTSAGLLVTGTLGVILIHNIADFLMVRRSVRLQYDKSSMTSTA